MPLPLPLPVLGACLLALLACGGSREAPLRDEGGVILVVTAPDRDAVAIDAEITVPIVDMLGAAGLDRFDAVSRPGAAIILIGPQGNALELVGRVRDAIQAFATTGPVDADPPLILRRGGEPYRYALRGPLSAMTLADLHRSRIVQQIDRTEGVAGVAVCGDRDDEIRIQVDPARLAAAGMEVEEVIRAVQSASVDLPAGRAEQPGREPSVRVLGQAFDLDALTGLPVGPQLRLADVARIEHGVGPATCHAWYRGQPVLTGALSLGSAGALAGVKDRLTQLGADLPEGATIIWIGRRGDQGGDLRLLRVAPAPGAGAELVRAIDRAVAAATGTDQLLVESGGGALPGMIEVWVHTGADAAAAAVTAVRALPGVLAAREVGGSRDDAALLSCDDPRALDSAAAAVRGAARPGARVLGDAGAPELAVDLDRAKLAELGVPAGAVARALAAAAGGVPTGTSVRDGRRIPVRTVLSARIPDDLATIHVRAASGALVPLSAVTRVEQRASREVILRSQGRRVLPVWIELGGLGRGAAMTALNELLPPGCRVEPARPDRW